MLRPTAGESSSSVTQSIEQPADDRFDVFDDRGPEVRTGEHRTHGARLRVGECQRRGGSPPPRGRT